MNTAILKQIPVATLLMAVLGLSSCGLFKNSRKVPSDYSTKSVSAQQLMISYIDQYRTIAMQEQARAGIPASITLAQGLLESGAGRSDLAIQANNHFGIKCPGGWSGPTYFKKDDDKDPFGAIIPSCFRKYNTAQESYLGHTEFLHDPKKSNRYGSLFQLQPTDYEGWAAGLTRAGYSTNPDYGSQLIKLVDDYQLHQYDLMVSNSNPTTVNNNYPNGNINNNNNGGYNPNGNNNNNNNNGGYNPNGNNNNNNNNGGYNPNGNYPNNPSANTNPSSSPTNLQPYNPNYPNGYPNYPNNGNINSNNNGGYNGSFPPVNSNLPADGNNNSVRFIRSFGGLTLEQIAARNDLRLTSIIDYNDGMIDATKQLPEGTMIYTQKKRGFSTDIKTYRIQPCETMFDVAQKFGVGLNKLLSRNHLIDGEQPRIGSEISLRRGWFEKINRPALRDTFGEWVNCRQVEYNNTTTNPMNTSRSSNPNDGGFDVTPAGSASSVNNYPQTQPNTYPQNTTPSQPNYYPSSEIPASGSNGSVSYPTTTYPSGTTTYPSSTTTYPSGTTTYPSSTTTYPSSTTTYPSGTTTYPNDNSSSPTTTYPSSSPTYPTYKPSPKPIPPTPPAGLPKPMPIPASNSYVVKPGETLWRISKQFGTTVDRLRALNNLPDNALKVGQTLIIK